jgi:hypothetical protein
MVNLTSLLLSEDVGEEAKKRNLHHIGWGRYADASGKLVAKSVDGKLVDVPKDELDPEVDQPTRDIEGLPNEKRPGAWKNWKPKLSTTDDELRQYNYASRAIRAIGPVMGSEREIKHRKLPPGEVTYEKGAGNPYVARNPDGKLASFSHDTFAAAFANGKSLKGYDFVKDYDGSMKKLSKELKPTLDKLKSAETGTNDKGKIKSFLRDLVTAFVLGTRRGRKGSRASSSGGSGFGGGGGFSGGGGGSSF